MHRNQNHAGLMPQSLRATIGRKTIDLFSILRHWNLRNLTLQQECYLTSSRDFFRNTHGSIMLPPRQPRVFARLGSLAIISRASNQKKPVNFSAAKTVLFNDQFKIVTTTMKRGFAQMHLTTILIGYFKLPVFIQCIYQLG